MSSEIAELEGQILELKKRLAELRAESPGYERILEHLDSRSDLFLYFGGSRSFSFLPEFGYTVDLEGAEVRDSYYEVAE